MHFNTSHLEKQEKLALLLDAKEICKEIVFEELNVETSFKRNKTDKTFADIFNYLQDSKIHFFVGKRFNKHINQFYGEISVCTLANPVDYFIFIYLDASDIDALLKKYDLI